jgi:hypothetical protein
MSERTLPEDAARALGFVGLTVGVTLAGGCRRT